jgi:hypothetical protein
LPRANFFGSRQRNFKNHFSTSNFFFYPQHTLVQNLCSNLAQF